MNRRKFLGLTGGSVLLTGATIYLLSDKNNFVRSDIKKEPAKDFLNDDERQILYLASLAPSGHNTQPWFVKYIQPYHYVIGNDKSRWLPGVDPTQRETILSIGAFIQNLEYAANSLGYSCIFNSLAITNQDENMVEVHLKRERHKLSDDVQKISRRRTLRSNFLQNPIKKIDLDCLLKEETDSVYFIPNIAREYSYLNEQTIEANKIQAYRDGAEKELSEWMRFSSKEAEKHRDGLTTAGMEITGIPGWILRNFYSKQNVMKKAFRDQSISNVIEQVSHSAGWMLITSQGNSVETLLDTGKRMQRLFLKVRDKGIAMHPMTQILEEPAIHQSLNHSLGITNTVQFILRLGYVKNYPEPVILRRPVDWMLRS